MQESLDVTQLALTTCFVEPGGLQNVTTEECDGPLQAFEVESEPDVDVRRELARAVVTRGWGLLELRPVRMSLEDVFLQVTTEELPEEAPHA